MSKIKLFKNISDISLLDIENHNINIKFILYNFPIERWTKANTVLLF